MSTPRERVQAAWTTRDPLTLHREVEQLATQGQSRQTLEDALEALLLSIRSAGANDESEEIINGVWDRLTGWCHATRHIVPRDKKNDHAVVVPAVTGSSTTPATAHASADGQVFTPTEQRLSHD